jgi:hypothetical protein
MKVERMKLRSLDRKVVVVLMVAGLLVGALCTLALAKNQTLFDKGIDMMVRAKNVMRDGVGTIQKGQEMYVKIAQEQGFADDVAQGNQKIDEGVNQGREGVALLDQGQKEYQTVKGKNPKAADAAVKKMLEGGTKVQDALKVIKEGVKMNNDVLRAKNPASQMEAPTRTILKGTQSALTGVKQFVKGQKLVSENM